MADLSYLDERDGWHHRIEDIIAYYEARSPIEFELPEEMTEDFLARIPRQRLVVSEMMAEGVYPSESQPHD